jgi:hypothetical protein
MRADGQAGRLTIGRKDGYDEANSRISQFCERAWNNVWNFVEWENWKYE